MKRFVLTVFLLLFVFFSTLKSPQVLAQTSQNVVLSCLDATILDPPKQTLNGVFYNHLLSLKNRELGVFSPNQPVYIVRSIPRVFCDPRINDPNCIKVEPEELQRCNQEVMGADICNRDCPWANGACIQNNVGPGSTRCCMVNYQKNGPYFECAKDTNGQVVCPSSILAQDERAGGIRVAEDGHIETGLKSSLILALNTKESLLADSEGNIFIPAAHSYTIVGNDHSFYGLQVLSDEAMNENEAFNNSLKLAVFAEIEEIVPSATNCTTVYWDPYGKIIDSLRLEPIQNVIILLKNLNSFNQVVNSNFPNNPTFRNPDQTNAAGDFNFAVNPGTYYLLPSHPDFNFPSDPLLLDNARSVLANVDPNQEYIARDKLYNNSEEGIVEVARESQRRDIILTPKDQNYAGTTPIILYAENLRDEDNQLIRGRISHPKSLVKIYLGNTLVAQTETDWKGFFAVKILGETINSGTAGIQIIAEKTPLVQANKPKVSPFGLFAKIFKSVSAQTNTTTSRAYSLSLVPVRLSGFVFDPTLQVKPNAVVKLQIPALGNLTYSQTKADADGFISVDSTNLPPFGFVLAVEDKSNPTKTYQLTIEDFKKTNGLLYEETGANLYNNSYELTKPNSQTVAKILKETPRQVSPTTLSYNQPSPNPKPNQASLVSTETKKNPSSVFLFALIGAIVVSGAIILILKSRVKKQIYY